MLYIYLGITMGATYGIFAYVPSLFETVDQAAIIAKIKSRYAF